MVIPYNTADGQQHIQTLNLSELQQAAVAGGGNIEILMPEGAKFTASADELMAAAGGNVEIRYENSSEEHVQGECVKL